MVIADVSLEEFAMSLIHVLMTKTPPKHHSEGNQSRDQLPDPIGDKQTVY